MIRFCLYGPFNCISFHHFSWQLSVFSLCSSGLISLPYWSFQLHISVKVSFGPDIIPSGWLGSKHQLPTYLPACCQGFEVLNESESHRIFFSVQVSTSDLEFKVCIAFFIVCMCTWLAWADHFCSKSHCYFPGLWHSVLLISDSESELSHSFHLVQDIGLSGKNSRCITAPVGTF